MSTLKTTNLQNASAASPAFVLAADGSATANLSSVNGGALSGMRNRILNGDMRLDQRNAGASVTPANGAYTLDRWLTYNSAASKYSIQQSSTAPTGFTKSALITSLSAYTVGASETFLFGQKIEGFNVADLAWGTASARTVTLSFWVRSSLTGTFGGSIGNGSDNRWYPFSYTISAANTWEQKTLTIAGDTSGTWNTDNTNGMNLYFNLGTGSTLSGTAGAWGSTVYYSATGATSVVGTNGATFLITGVQLEPGSTATPFERRSFGQELALCQRYYQTMYANSRQYSRTNGVYFQVPLPFFCQMRVAPTAQLSGGTPTSVSADAVANINPNGAAYQITSTATATEAGYENRLITLSAEL